MSDATAPRALFDEAIELVNAGKADQARRLCVDALARHPKEINMRALLGALLLKSGQLRKAREVLAQTIELAPSFAKPYEDLGITLLALNEPEPAAKYLGKAVELDPGLEVGWLNLGRALARLGRGAEADEAFEKSFALNPERAMLARAARLHQQNELDEAAEVYQRVLRNNPRNVDALRLLGMIEFSNGHLDVAERNLRRAVQLAPDFVGAQVDLGRVLKEMVRYEESIACLEKAVQLEPAIAANYFLLAASQAPASRTFEALENYQRALELRPNHAGALLGLGHVLKTVGRQQEAIDAYRRCIEVKPENGEPYWSLANLKTYRFSDEDIAEMSGRAGEEQVSDQSRVNFLFSLGKAWEDRGDYDKAWQYYRDGNQKQRMLEHYDPVQNEVMNDSIMEVFDAALLGRLGGQGSPDPSPIFVVGLPRSGSTLIEQILASHSQVEGTSELPYLGRVATSLNRNRADGVNYPQAVRELGAGNLHDLGADYLARARLHRREGTPRFIDKMPNNFPSIGFASLILPNAKIIDARRHPLDACLGCYKQLFAQGQSFTYDLTDIGEYFVQYEALIDHWNEVLPGRVLTVQYEEMVGDTEAQIRRLVEFCGLPWEDACLRFFETERPVRTASSEQVRQPIYSSSVGQWRRFEPYLGELIEVLEPVLPRYECYAGGQ